ncbi:hypothetical protein [Arthrobacter monumenti]
MSKDQESLRSRRALRQAREAQSGQADEPQNGYPSVPVVPAPAPGAVGNSGRDAEAGNESGATNDQQNQVQQPGGQQPAEQQKPSRRRRVADSPVDAPVSKPAERTSQARARDRENLRAYKALSEQEARKESSAPLTRRQLRQQQLEAERRAAGLSTSRLPIVPPSSPGQGGTKQESTNASGSPVQNKSGQNHGSESAPAPGPENTLNDLSVEEALAARSALVEQAKNQMAMLNASEQDPKTVDLEVLAEQKKLAERAAVLNQRAIAKQRLSEQNRQRTSQQNDPTSAHNLAMVTPLEFVKIPGIDRPVMKPPTTSHIPVITSSTPRVPRPAPGPASNLSSRPAPTPPARQKTEDAAVGHSRNTGQAGARGSSRSNVLARAEAAARTAPSRTASAGRQLPPQESAPGSMEEGGPISAHTAHGLEPLDSMTAGMGRVRRQRLLEVLIFALGAIALMVGLIMIMGG